MTTTPGSRPGYTFLAFQVFNIFFLLLPRNLFNQSPEEVKMLARREFEHNLRSWLPESVISIYSYKTYY